MSDRSKEPLLFDRELMIEVMVYHWPTKNSGCHCGWSELGRSFPEHVVEVYEHRIFYQLRGDKWNHKKCL